MKPMKAADTYAQSYHLPSVCLQQLSQAFPMKTPYGNLLIIQQVLKEKKSTESKPAAQTLISSFYLNILSWFA